MTTGTADRHNHKHIQECFPWGYHTSHLLNTRCICIPLRIGNYYSVMFVMNINRLMKKNTDKMDDDDDEDDVPVVYHFDSSPDTLKHQRQGIRP